jgi:lipopolysaccharide export system permease protein
VFLPTLERYIAREVILTLLAVMSVVGTIIIGNLFVRMLTRASEGIFPADVLLPLVLYGSVRAFSYLAPIALFLATMLAFGRLYKDSEISAMQACGVGYARWYRAVFVLGIPFALLVGWAVFYLAPWAVVQTESLRAEVKTRTELSGVTPGRFLESPDGARTIFVEHIDQASGDLKNVFIYSEVDGKSQLAVAARATVENDEASGKASIVLRDGHRYEGEVGSAVYTIAQFGAHGFALPAPGESAMSERMSMLMPKQLLESSDPRVNAEFHWRLAIPVSGLVLLLLAVPLSYTSPRQGRFGKLALGILIYVVYANLLTLAKTWLERDEVPGWVGLWWVHALMVAFALLLLARRYGHGSLRLRGRR